MAASIQDLDTIEARIRQWEGEQYFILGHDEIPPQIYDKSEQQRPLDYQQYSIWFQTY